MSVDAGKVQLADVSGNFITGTNRLPADANIQIGNANVVGTNPVPVSMQIGNTVIANANPVPESPIISGSPVTGTNPMPVSMQIGNTVISSANPVPVADLGSTNFFFTRATVASTAFSAQQITFGFTSRRVKVIDDETGANVQFSFDGTTLAGIARPTEQLEFDGIRFTQIYLRATTVGGTFRIWAW